MRGLSATWTDSFFGFCGTGDRDFGHFGVGSRGDTEALADLCVHPGEDVLILLEEIAGVFAALADALARVAVPRAGFLNDVVGDGEIEHIALTADAFSVENVELGFAEGRGHLVLDDLDLGARADDGIAFLDGGDAADVDTDRGVELECATAGGGFGVAEHDTDFFADLVDENQRGAGLGYRSGELAQGLRHQ